MMGRSSIKIWLSFLGTIIFAIGLAFNIIDELTSYKTVSLILMAVGIAIILISNFYKLNSRS